MTVRAQSRDRADLARMLGDWRSFKARAWNAIAVSTWSIAIVYAASLWMPA